MQEIADRKGDRERTADDAQKARKMERQRGREGERGKERSRGRQRRKKLRFKGSELEDVDTHKGRVRMTQRQPGSLRRREICSKKPRDREDGTLSALPKHPAPKAKAGEGPHRPWGKVGDFPWRPPTSPQPQRDWL